GELVRLLLAHPGVRITLLGGAGSAGKELSEIHPHLSGSDLAGVRVRPLAEIAEAAAAGEFEFALLALPNGTSAHVAPAILDAGVRVIDLAGDFRLPAAAYPEWYGFEHPAPEWLDKAVYGLPELFGDQLRGARLLSNPGCFPTPVVLGLAPLLSAGLIEPEPILVDGKTGLSGAGKTVTEETSFAATEESIRPYRVPRHQHTPEMERALELASGSEASVSFVPHLVPSVRGVLTTCYAPLAEDATSTTLTECLARAYAGRPFVRVLPPGGMVDTKRTRASNVVELQAVADPRTETAIVAGALDNLVKGAAGQAIQNLNLMAGLDEALGLPTAAVYP
ncbi:MAG: N-acetyl-gamma-glutamyl-phosphate reductase, partial [Actinomycetota bacterium]